MNEKSIARAERAIDAIREGQIVILVDDEDRENEGDLVIAAECVTPEAINFMATHGRGLICLAMTGEQLDKLQIPMMVHDNTSPFSTAFTVSIEAAEGVTTGISAADRSRTVQAAIAPDSTPADIVMPGHDVGELDDQTLGHPARVAGQPQDRPEQRRRQVEIADLVPDRPRQARGRLLHVQRLRAGQEIGRPVMPLLGQDGRRDARHIARIHP